MDQRRKAYDIFPQLVVPDEFMRRVETQTSWTLVDPHEVREKLNIDLPSLWGDAFEAAYHQVEESLDTKITLYKKVNARHLFKEVMRSTIETGMPYLWFKDTVNRANPNKHDGYIPNGNLCVAPETKILTSTGNLEIQTLEDKPVFVWNGEEWSPTVVKKTGVDQELMKVTVKIDSLDQGGSFFRSLECTLYHKWYIKKAGKVEEVRAQDLTVGDTTHSFCYSDDPHLVEGTITAIERTGRISDTYCFEEPMRHMGMFNGILTGQCQESYSNVSPGKYAHLCNLSSLNLANIDDDIAEACEVAVRLLDNTIEITTPPFADAKDHNQRYRTIGVGAMGLADWLAKWKLGYGDIAAIDDLFEQIGYHCTRASADLARERGAYPAFEGSDWSKGLLIGSKDLDWYRSNAGDYPRWEQLSVDIQKYGIRNSHITAIAPNTSSSLVQGCTASILPTYSKFFYDKWAKGTVPIAPPFIDEAFWYYQENKTLDQRIVVEAVSTMQKWIDTGISMELIFNLNKGIYFSEDRPLNAKDIYEVLMMAWKKECKAIYYIRTVQKDDFKEEGGCVSCAN